MTLQSRLFFATAALLYLGPLFAGLSGHGFVAAPIFLVLFMLWLWVVHPKHFPRTAAGWRDSSGYIPVLRRTVRQALLVVFCLVVGRGLGGIMGFILPLPLVIAVLISMLAIAFARLLHWNLTDEQKAALIAAGTEPDNSGR